jgi:hypothetical protein
LFENIAVPSFVFTVCEVHTTYTAILCLFFNEVSTLQLYSQKVLEISRLCAGLCKVWVASFMLNPP